MVRHPFEAPTGLVFALLMLTSSLAGAAEVAQGRAPVSEIVLDVSTNRTLYAFNATRQRPPASLAKVMTLLLVFDALDSGRLRDGESIAMTASGARQAPTRFGLKRGQTLSVTNAVRAVAVISANDVAVALADRLGGSEAKFVNQMNRRAAEIGMTATRFGNATGLAPGAGLTTAHDMAVLARYVIQRHPNRYKVFATRFIRWKGWTRPNHNQLLGRVEGLDGMKTGYTVPAGFNLIASAQRARRRVAIIVMGASTGTARDLAVANLVEVGFTSPGVTRSALPPDAKPRDTPGKRLAARPDQRASSQPRRAQAASDKKPAHPAAKLKRRDPPRSNATSRQQPEALRRLLFRQGR